MTNKPTYIEKIDIVFDLIYNKQPVEEEVISNLVSNIMNAGQLHAIIVNLSEDGYIYKTSQIEYSITFKGYLFNEFGGYRGKLSNEINIKTKAETYLKNDLLYRDRLLLATWTAGIVAFLLLLWQIFLFYFPHYIDYPYHWIWEANRK